MQKVTGECQLIRNIHQGSQARGPRVRFGRPVMLFGNFQIINIYVISFITGVTNL